jgi:hypothetical protein
MLKMLKTISGESIVSKSNVFKWHKHFREGRDLNNYEMQGSPLAKGMDKNIAKSKVLV